LFEVSGSAPDDVAVAMAEGITRQQKQIFPWSMDGRIARTFGFAVASRDSDVQVIWRLRWRLNVGFRSEGCAVGGVRLCLAALQLGSTSAGLGDRAIR
jgi:hypothetical protein